MKNINMDNYKRRFLDDLFNNGIDDVDINVINDKVGNPKCYKFTFNTQLGYDINAYMKYEPTSKGTFCAEYKINEEVIKVSISDNYDQFYKSIFEI